MHKYRVIEYHTVQRRLLLEGGVGRYHWACVLNGVPRVGDMLSGSRPHLGFGLLQCSPSALSLRVIFEAINSVDPGFDPGWTAGPLSTRRSRAAPADH
jgi:hypothetical protein